MDVVYSVAASLDGFIASTDGGVDWLPPFEPGGGDFGLGAFLASVDAIVMGRESYEVARRLGPWTYTQPATVMTRTPLVDAPGGVESSDAGPAEVVAGLAAQGRRRVWLFGGGRLAASFLDAGLVTHVDVAVVPVVLGEGVPLVGRLGSLARLGLEKAETHSAGVVGLRYRVLDP
jgi:dihydrofolate reductase